jgi:hypothetical protein
MTLKQVLEHIRAKIPDMCKIATVAARVMRTRLGSMGLNSSTSRVRVLKKRRLIFFHGRDSKRGDPFAVRENPCPRSWSP